jgi:hypothetical protein
VSVPSLRSPISYSPKRTCRPNPSRPRSPTMDPDTPPPPSQPSLFNYTLGFLLVGIAWGFTTPFIRRAAVNYNAPDPSTHPSIADPKRSWLSRKIALGFWTVAGLLRRPEYAVPLLVNLTGSIWFFLLVGKAGTFILCCIGSEALRT